MLQAILLTSSLLLVVGMCASLMWLAAVRETATEVVAPPSPEPDVVYGNVSATSSGTGVPPTVSAMYCFPSSM